jgi:hypothetical protein
MAKGRKVSVVVNVAKQFKVCAPPHATYGERIFIENIQELFGVFPRKVHMHKSNEHAVVMNFI